MAVYHNLKNKRIDGPMMGGTLMSENETFSKFLYFKVCILKLRVWTWLNGYDLDCDIIFCPIMAK